MWTVQLQQPHMAAEGSERDELLPEDFHVQWQVVQFVGKTHRLPEATHIFATRRAGADMREFGVLSGDSAMKIAAKSHPQKRGSVGHGSSPSATGGMPEVQFTRQMPDRLSFSAVALRFGDGSADSCAKICESA